MNSWHQDEALDPNNNRPYDKSNDPNYILNPVSGRYVLRDGPTGQKILYGDNPPRARITRERRGPVYSINKVTRNGDRYRSPKEIERERELEREQELEREHEREREKEKRRELEKNKRSLDRRRERLRDYDRERDLKEYRKFAKPQEPKRPKTTQTILTLFNEDISPTREAMEHKKKHNLIQMGGEISREIVQEVEPKAVVRPRTLHVTKSRFLPPGAITGTTPISAPGGGVKLSGKPKKVERSSPKRSARNLKQPRTSISPGKGKSPKTLTERPKRTVYIYTDGAVSNNKRDSNLSRGGVGVYFGLRDKRNLSERFSQGPTTNQRAELWAIIRALQTIKKDSQNKTYLAAIYTDSMYALNILTKVWKAHDNLDLVEQGWKLLEEVPNVQIRHIRAHTGKKDPHSIGNKMADQLAAKARDVEVAKLTAQTKRFDNIETDRVDRIQSDL